MALLYMISLISFLVGISLFFLRWYLENKKRYILNPRKKCSFAIVIPAKDESKVITKLLDSIKIQIKDFSNVYVIVEDKKDKTCAITKKYKGNIIVRKDLEGKRNKGYALDEAIKDILNKKKYNLYFVIDADTTLEKDFLKEMINSYKRGYDIIIPYKNSSSCDNVIKSCSALTFSFINNIVNYKKAKLNQSLLISGSGIAISDKLINKWNGYPFYSLTEDYELTLYCSCNNVPMFYNKNAICYVEHPSNIKDSIKQRSRWIKGFFEARKKSIEKVNDYSSLLGIFPHLFLITGFVLFVLASLIHTVYYLFFSSYLYYYTLITTLVVLGLAYFFLCLVTIWTLHKEKTIFNISKKEATKAIFFNPIFLATYLICLVKALCKKSKNWETISHKEKDIKLIKK